MPKDAVPPIPEGFTLLSFLRRRVWDCLWGGKFPFASTDTVKVGWNGSDYFFTAQPARAGGGAGWDWMYASHKELDPTLTYSAGKAAYVSPQSALATTGLMDLVAGVVTTVAPGTWLCVKNVPAQTTVAGVVKYNVPQPVTQLGAPAGSPLKGDADNAAVFWIPLHTSGGCDSLGNVV
jgi:hypothetical protein